MNDKQVIELVGSHVLACSQQSQAVSQVFLLQFYAK